jgi:hypothetical protein
MPAHAYSKNEHGEEWNTSKTNSKKRWRGGELLTIVAALWVHSNSVQTPSKHYSPTTESSAPSNSVSQSQVLIQSSYILQAPCSQKKNQSSTTGSHKHHRTVQTKHGSQHADICSFILSGVSWTSQLCDSRSAVHRTWCPVEWDTQTRIPSRRTQIPVRLDSLNGKSCIQKTKTRSNKHIDPILKAQSDSSRLEALKNMNNPRVKKYCCASNMGHQLKYKAINWLSSLKAFGIAPVRLQPERFLGLVDWR